MFEQVWKTKSKSAKTPNPRASGLLVHPVSFPSDYGIGDLGKGAFAFIDFMKLAKQRLWQVLPLGPTGYGDSPYQSFSSCAGNHYLIDPEKLMEKGFLSKEDLDDAPNFDPRRIDYGPVIEYKMKLLRLAFSNYKKNATSAQKALVTKFVNKNKNWLDNYALFTAIKDFYGQKSWIEWPEPAASRDEEEINKLSKDLEPEIEFVVFCQYEFFRQWDELKKYANEAGIAIIGDIPIFAAFDSADVWANQHLFKLDKEGKPTAVAGVPPDYFTETGQLWGNPLYNWPEHKKDNYQWWAERISATFNMVDIVRIDHFRGFEAYWAVPAKDKTAENGKWQKGPGNPFFEALKATLGSLPIIAEDLGEITEKVDALRKAQNFPGMKVLQFAFEPDGKNAHLPLNYESNRTVVYTGTHDNNTTLGWYNELDEAQKHYLRRLLNVSGDDIAWDLIRYAFSTNANYVIIPIQDVLNLGEEDRMNSPGKDSGCWQFRYTEDMLNLNQAAGLSYFTDLFNRV